jgi:hypothetical protein
MHSPILIPDHEIELTAVRSQGAGGQNVNILCLINLSTNRLKHGQFFDTAACASSNGVSEAAHVLAP